MTDADGGRRWGYDLAVLLGALAFFLLLHPAPGVLWLEYSWIAYNLLPLPLSLAGMTEAIRWQATVFAPNLARPTRAIQWWLAGKALGCSALGYHVVNALTLSIAVWAVSRVAGALTTSRMRGLLVGTCLAVSYVTVYPILIFGFGFAAACAFGGLTLYFRSENRQGPARLLVQAVAVLLLLVGGLSHETFLAFVLIPLAHAVLVRRDRAAALRALAFVAILPIYAVYGELQASLHGGAPAVRGIRAALSESPEVIGETFSRVLFTVLSGGLPLDPLRALPYVPEFTRIREFVLSPAGLVTLAIVVMPTLALAALALIASRGEATARRRIGFYLVWLGLGSVPLVLPAGAPEAFHLTGALPALFLLWTEGLALSSDRRGPAGVTAWALLLFWVGVHGMTRWVLFHQDVPAMARSVQALHRVLAQAEMEGKQANVLFFPAQIGGHYGMMPTVPALYFVGSAWGTCLRGDRPRGCLVEPIWVWSTLRAWPPVPEACRTTDGIRVGPRHPSVERQLEGSRRMLAHPSVSLTEQNDPRLLSTCPVQRLEPIRIGGASYWLYRVDSSAETRWYRFSLEPGPALVPLMECGAVTQ